MLLRRYLRNKWKFLPLCTSHITAQIRESVRRTARKIQESNWAWSFLPDCFSTVTCPKISHSTYAPDSYHIHNFGLNDHDKFDFFLSRLDLHSCSTCNTWIKEAALPKFKRSKRSVSLLNVGDLIKNVFASTLIGELCPWLVFSRHNEHEAARQGGVCQAFINPMQSVDSCAYFIRYYFVLKTALIVGLSYIWSRQN